MAHNIDMTNGRANIAFLGSRKDVWHQLGQEMAAGMSLDDWAAAAGLAWSAVKVPAIAQLHGEQFDHLPASQRFQRVENRSFLVRSDNGYPLGYVSGDEGEGYQQVQPRECLEWFQNYIAVDDRFVIDTAGSLKKGEIIWAMARFLEPMDIIGEKHKAHLLMTTTFDGSGATQNRACMTRVVCNNTLDAAAMEADKAVIRTRHNTKFNADKVRRELAAVASGFTAYKRMAECMVAEHMSREQVSHFFKACLDIPFDAKADDISGKKMSAFNALRDSYRDTVLEGTAANTQWAALNAVTRYADHDKAIRANGGDELEARLLSSQFGSGAQLKSKAINLLMPADVRAKVLVAA